MRTLEDMRVCLEKYKSIIKDNSCNVRNTIIVIEGRLTLNNSLEVSNNDYPVQFTKSDADKLALQFLTNNPFMNVCCVDYLKWYENRITKIENMLQLLS